MATTHAIDDKSFLEYVIHALVDNHDAVVIERTVDDLGVFFKVHVAKDDMGKIIGKNGKTAEALKILLRIVGAKTDSRINMKIVDQEKDEGIVEEA